MSKKRDILCKTIWFDNRVKVDDGLFDLMHPQRTVSTNPRYKNGVYWSHKCQRNIQYESGMELEFFKKLEQSDKVKYYFEQPVCIKFRRGKKNLTYTPDVGIFLKTNEFIIAEIKTLPEMLDHHVGMKIEALLDFCSRKGFGLLFTDGKHSFDDLLKLKTNRKLEKEILTALANNNVIRKNQYNAIIDSCQPAHTDLYKIVIKHNLAYKPFPFKLQHGNKNTIFRQVFIEKKNYDSLFTAF